MKREYENMRGSYSRMTTMQVRYKLGVQIKKEAGLLITAIKLKLP